VSEYGAFATMYWIKLAQIGLQ